jgi:carboxylesterase type B
MYIKHLIALLLVTLISYSSCFAQKQVLYKQIDTTKLYLEIYYPEKALITNENPAIVFFFGGGWKGGDRYHFVHQASYFSKRGLVCFLANYRTENKNLTTPNVLGLGYKFSF